MPDICIHLNCLPLQFYFYESKLRYWNNCSLLKFHIAETKKKTTSTPTNRNRLVPKVKKIKQTWMPSQGSLNSRCHLYCKFLHTLHYRRSVHFVKFIVHVLLILEGWSSSCPLHLDCWSYLRRKLR